MRLVFLLAAYGPDNSHGPNSHRTSPQQKLFLWGYVKYHVYWLLYHEPLLNYFQGHVGGTVGFEDVAALTKDNAVF
jgi:hypothetical protein